MDQTELQTLRAVLKDPVAFSKGFLKHRLWSRQEEILRAIERYRRVAVKACHSSGKSFIAADAALWWLLKYSDGIVITTAPTWTQVSKVMWDYIHKAIDNSRFNFGEVNQTEFKIGPGNFAIGLSTDQGVRFQGYKGRILLILDEAPGIKSDIWEAIEGMAAGGDVHMLALGNPTKASGAFYDAFNKNREAWHTLTISAFDTPNLEGLDLDKLLKLSDEELDKEVFPGLVNRRWVKEKLLEYGPNHYFYQSRVLGEFPQNQADALIPMEVIDRSRVFKASEESTIVGVDVAGQGRDRTVMIIRNGMHVQKILSWRKDDARGDVVAELKKYNKITMVNVDSVGIGYNFALHIRDQGFPVKLINVGEAPKNSERFKNAKAEKFWQLRELFIEGVITGITDDTLAEELKRLRYGFNERGQMVMESKDDIRKHEGYSPDFADALMLCYAYTPPKLNQTAQTSQYRPKPFTAGLLSKRL